MKGSNLSDILVVWLLTKKLDTPIKMLQCFRSPSIAEDTKKQLGILDANCCQLWAYGQRIGVSHKEGMPIVCNATRFKSVIAIHNEMETIMGGKGAREKRVVDRFRFSPRKKKGTGKKRVVRKKTPTNKKTSTERGRCSELVKMNCLHVEGNAQLQEIVVVGDAEET